MSAAPYKGQIYSGKVCPLVQLRRSGLFGNDTLRLPVFLDNAVMRAGAAGDTTMNQFLIVAIAEKISVMKTVDVFER